jgi:hypothetical protein
MAQNRLSDDLFKELLFKELNSGNEKAHLKTNFYEYLRKNKYSCNKTRSLNLHDLYYNEWVILSEKIRIDNIKNTQEYKKDIIDSKIKQMSNNLLDIINKKITVEEKAYDMQLGKVVVYNREPNPMEIIEAIKEYNRINGL